jgi:hypothetical protein
LNDEELERLAKTQLLPEARQVLAAEMIARGLAPDGPEPATPTTNPYATPNSTVSDPNAWATLKVTGIIRLFQVMVCASTVIFLFIAFWAFLPIPMAEKVAGLRNAAAADALAPGIVDFLSWALQPLWILSAVGLCFFKWWARPLFAGIYVLGSIGTLLGGLVLWLSWEAVLVTVAILLDGAVLALAFLPPLSAYFERDRLAA